MSSCFGMFGVRLLLLLSLMERTVNLMTISSTQKGITYTTKERGSEYTADYRLYFNGSNGLISPFHDIPLYVDKENITYHMVVEIPRWTNAKMEITTKEKMNPIKQDVKNGKMRFVSNIFPYNGYIWNYGALPQTWEDPKEIDEHTKKGGDNDLIDALEIGHMVAKRGEVKQVKILGTYALIDEAETDWKIITIDVKDPLAKNVTDISDIKKHFPGLLEATHQWFQLYKIPTGKPENRYAFDGKPKDKSFATNIVALSHKFWQRLIRNESRNTEEFACENVSVDGSPYRISQEDANKFEAKIPPRNKSKSVTTDVHRWHFLTQSKIFAVANECNSTNAVPSSANDQFSSFLFQIIGILFSLLFVRN